MKTMRFGLSSINYWMACQQAEAGRTLVLCATAVAVAFILTRKR